MRSLADSLHFESVRDSKFHEAKISRLFEEGKVHVIPADAMLCEYGDKANMMYFLVSGRLSVYMPKSEAEMKR